MVIHAAVIVFLLFNSEKKRSWIMCPMFQLWKTRDWTRFTALFREQFNLDRLAEVANPIQTLRSALKTTVHSTILCSSAHSNVIIHRWMQADSVFWEMDSTPNYINQAQAPTRRIFQASPGNIRFPNLILGPPRQKVWNAIKQIKVQGITSAVNSQRWQWFTDVNAENS